MDSPFKTFIRKADDVKYALPRAMNHLDHIPAAACIAVSQRGSSESADQPIRGWLDEFASAVRAADYARGRTLFADDVVSFGTFARMLIGADHLVTDQWQNIWGCTRGFRFLMDEAHIVVAEDENFAWVAAPWTSQGRDAKGNWYDRPGRCTLVLRRGRDAQWLCCHSHFSRQPAPISNGDATPT